MGKFHSHIGKVICVDERLNTEKAQVQLRDFLETRGIGRAGALASRAGSVLELAQDEVPKGDFSLYQGIKGAMIDLHHVTTLVITMHTDCGRQGGRAAFNGDAEADKEAQRVYLRRVAKRLHEWFPSVTHVVPVLIHIADTNAAEPDLEFELVKETV